MSADQIVNQTYETERSKLKDTYVYAQVLCKPLVSDKIKVSYKLDFEEVFKHLARQKYDALWKRIEAMQPTDERVELMRALNVSLGHIRSCEQFYGPMTA